MRSFFSLLIVVLTFVSCTTSKQICYPQYELTNAPTKTPRNLSFEDDCIVADFEVKRDNIVFSLNNKSDKAFRINWDESAIVRDGISNPIMHIGTKYIDRNAPKSKTIVAPYTMIKDGLWIASDVSLNQDVWTGVSGWTHRDFYNVTRLDGMTKEELFKSLTGRTLSVVLTIEFESGPKSYMFDFRIVNVTDAERTQSKDIDGIYGR